VPGEGLALNRMESDENRPAKIPLAVGHTARVFFAGVFLENFYFTFAYLPLSLSLSLVFS